MDKVIINPEHIRGGGNITSPIAHTDFLKYRGILTDTTGYNNTRCFSLVFYGNNLVLTVVNPYVSPEEELTVYATFTDHDGDGIEGASIKLYLIGEDE